MNTPCIGLVTEGGATAPPSVVFNRLPLLNFHSQVRWVSTQDLRWWSLDNLPAVFDALQGIGQLLDLLVLLDYLFFLELNHLVEFFNLSIKGGNLLILVVPVIDKIGDYFLQVFFA